VPMLTGNDTIALAEAMSFYHVACRTKRPPPLKILFLFPLLPQRIQETILSSNRN
jgi:hypothetical protein